MSNTDTFSAGQQLKSPIVNLSSLRFNRPGALLAADWLLGLGGRALGLDEAE